MTSYDIAKKTVGVFGFYHKIAALVLLAFVFFAGSANCVAIGKKGAKESSASAKNNAKDRHPKSNTPITITSDRLEIDKGVGHIVFSGNVAAMEDFTLCSDELTLLYGISKEISELSASGNVRIFYKDRKAVAEKAIYDRDNRTVVLTGNPEVTQCSDTLRGDKITVKLDEDNAYVESDGGKRVRAVIMPVKVCHGDQYSQKGTGEEALCKRTR